MLLIVQYLMDELVLGQLPIVFNILFAYLCLITRYGSNETGVLKVFLLSTSLKTQVEDIL